MECLHPFCPRGHGHPRWQDVIDDPRLKLRPADRAQLLAGLTVFGPLSNPPQIRPAPTQNAALLKRLLGLCPCLYNQLGKAATPRGTVHLCEVTLGAPITSASVYLAFRIQYPNKYEDFANPPAIPCTDGGTVMEMLCSEVLSNAGIPSMPLVTGGPDAGWPIWTMPGHILLNEGKMNDMRAFGDLLVPCAPTNLVISVKSEAARERLLYSSNSIEGIGFGFFNQPEEFWSVLRMKLYKRMGFSAIYLPNETLDLINAKLVETGHQNYAVNINGTALYRPLTEFTDDMVRVVGRSSFLL
jgi:hypothetical protein